MHACMHAHHLHLRVSRLFLSSARLLRQRREQCRPAHDPVVCRLVCRQLDCNNIVARVSRRGEDTLTFRCLVHRTEKVRHFRAVRLLHRFEVQDREFLIQDLGCLFCQHLGFQVPSCPIEEEAVHIRAFRRALRGFGVRHDHKVVRELINGNLVLTSIILLHTRQKRLRKVKARDPKARRRTVVKPRLQKFETGQQVVDVRSEWFERWVRRLLPVLRDLSFKHRVVHAFERVGHDDQTLDRLLDIHQGIVYPVDETIETRHLLHERRVERLFVLGGVLAQRHGRVKGWRQLGQHVFRNLRHHIVGRLATTATATSTGSLRHED
eukprot:m.124868 g.124868  ORF g.124868 m.124868 type:complete len:323 (-) comp11159_c2_seq4:10026-10994(-)